MKVKGLLLILVFFILPLFSFREQVIPNPEDFAKNLVASIAKNSKQDYLNTFGINSNDLFWMKQQMINDPYASAEEKAEWERKLSDTAAIVNDANSGLERGYDVLDEWVQTNGIHTAELEYIRITYELECEEKGLIPVIERGTVFIKYRDKFYGIEVGDAIYLNGKWVFGRIRDISECDSYLNTLWDNQYGEYAYADSAAVAVDTTAAMPDEYYAADTTAYVDYVEEEIELTKKQQKIQKKIDAQREKLMKLYDEMYNAE